MSSEISSIEPNEGAARKRSFHVSILAGASTLTRLGVGALSDKFRPEAPGKPSGRLTISTVAILLASTSLLLLGLAILSVPNLHPFPGHQPPVLDLLIVTTALVGVGYGAIFTLVPIIVNAVWGADGFGINWGTVATMSSAGVALWSMLYAWVYENGTDPTVSPRVCRAGWECYGAWGLATTGGVMVAMGAWAVAWKGKGGWQQRNVSV